jgi:hypothetical protein
MFRNENGILSGLALPIVLLISTWLPGCGWPDLGAKPFVPDNLLIQLINFTGFGLLMSYFGTKIRLYLEGMEYLDDSYSLESIINVSNTNIIYIISILISIPFLLFYFFFTFGRYARC